MKTTGRFFVRGMSRSGGTLMVTILDAHPDISMGYELYEHLLKPNPELRWNDIYDIIAQIEQKPTRGLLFRKKKTNEMHQKLKVFTARVLRGGVDQVMFANILRKFAQKGGDIKTTADRLRLLEQILQPKMDAEGKSCWGAKIAKSFQETFELWPDSRFLFMMRDGRDIAASRKNNGSFNQTIEDVAKGYVTQIKLFNEFSKQTGVNTNIVHYESLVAEPEPTLRTLFSNMSTPWSSTVLQHQEADLTIFKNPTGHLSANQVNKPINTNSVGRWKHDLSSSEASEFESIAGDCLEEFGYVCGQAAE